MVNTKSPYKPSAKISMALSELGEGFEFYLPDEKISQVWQETELISTNYPEFEAVYFERELEGGKIYISHELEFFPVYMLFQTMELGEPTIICEAIFPGNDLINIPEDAYVLIVGFTEPADSGRLEKNLPELEGMLDLELDDLIEMAEPYLKEITS